MSTKQKSFSRSLVRSNKFWSLKSDRERLFFVLVMLDLDNIGRGLGNEYYLKGKLYEKDHQTSAVDCKAFLQNCHDVGILIKYEIDGVIHIQDPIHAEHNKIVGNMKAESVYPQPPKEVIEKYLKSHTKLNFVKFNSSEGKGKGKGKGKELLKNKQQILTLCNKELSKLAKPSMIKSVLLQVKPTVWWIVGDYLQKQYPADNLTGYEKILKELKKEVNNG